MSGSRLGYVVWSIRFSWFNEEYLGLNFHLQILGELKLGL